jgi:hypothetical protein
MADDGMGTETFDFADDDLFMAALTPLAAEAHEALSNVILLLQARRESGKPPDYAGHIEAYDMVRRQLSNWPEVRRLIAELQLSVPPGTHTEPNAKEPPPILSFEEAKAALRGGGRLPVPGQDD